MIIRKIIFSIQIMDKTNQRRERCHIRFHQTRFLRGLKQLFNFVSFKKLDRFTREKICNYESLGKYDIKNTIVQKK